MLILLRDTFDTLRGEQRMETKLARIAEIARERPKEKFTSLAHLLNADMLKACHKELKSGKAPGVDQQTKKDYGENLDTNIEVLVEKLKQKSYRPQPVKRTYIPKPGSETKRPLGLPSHEDKIVQAALSKILNAIYEQDFLDFSYGFRPDRSCHDALQTLNHIIEKNKTSYVVDADIKGFFDHVDHQWMLRMLEERIKDPSIIRLIARILKAGCMEEGKYHETDSGTPQGGVVSPMLSNIYLHYALDLWFEKVYKKSCRGEAHMVRYADDFICCFQYKEDAERFYQELQERLQKFNLTISAEKSKILEFGRFAAANRVKRGAGKLETFDFLGFTHYCSMNIKGKFRVKRKTSRKKYKAKIQLMKQWVKDNRNTPIWDLMKMLRLKLTGHYRYYGITDNYKGLSSYYRDTICLLYKWLNRRSQRKSFNWGSFNLFLKVCGLPKPKIYVDIYGTGLSNGCIK